MTDKTKTARELALEALGDLTVAAYGLEEMVEASKIFNWSETIRNYLSQAEQTEPIDIEALKREVLALRPPHELSHGYTSGYLSGRYDAIEVINKFHNLTKAQK